MPTGNESMREETSYVFYGRVIRSHLNGFELYKSTSFVIPHSFVASGVMRRPSNKPTRWHAGLVVKDSVSASNALKIRSWSNSKLLKLFIWLWLNDLVVLFYRHHPAGAVSLLRRN